MYRSVRFIEEMISKTPGTRFFVDTDTATIIPILERKFGTTKVISVKRNCNTTDAVCVKFALVDALALAKCRELCSSHWSTFTDLAKLFGAPTRQPLESVYSPPESMLN